MIVSTNAIVLSALKYGDSSLIVKCYTQAEGLKSYMLRGVLSSKKGKVKAAYFQPLSQLKIVANHNNKGNLGSIKEVEVSYHYTGIYTSIIKQSITLFLSEILSSSIQEEEANEPLFFYLESALSWFDTQDQVSNFHLLFMLNLTRFLGFYPEMENHHYNYFDLLAGEFRAVTPLSSYISGSGLIQFNKLLGINFDTLQEVKFSSNERQQLLAILIEYFELHLGAFRKPKSLEVLQSLFQ